MLDSRAAGGHAMAAAGPWHGSPKFAANAAGQAGCVAHVPEHDLGAAAYAIKAAMAAAPAGRREIVRRRERDRRRSRIPGVRRDAVPADQARRDDICWNVFREVD